MTTLVALSTRDALVMGCDSLGTVTRRLVDPFDLSDYFDDNLKVKTRPDGRSLLDDFSKIYDKAEYIPYDHMTHVDKLFSLYPPLEMGLMFAGQVAIGNRTIKNLIGEFKATDKVFKGRATNYTLKSVAMRLLKFMWGYYYKEFPDERRRPELELMLGGYDKQKRIPGMIRIYVHKNEISDADYDFAIFFGGQTEGIQRLVFGTDRINKARLIGRSRSLLKRYHTLLSQELKKQGVKVRLKSPDKFGEELDLFHNWNLKGLDANVGAFSEQNAIECVDFLVDIMIRSHQFSSQMPSVGEPVQVAVIKKDVGFIFVSKREWRLGDHAVPARE